MANCLTASFNSRPVALADPLLPVMITDALQFVILFVATIVILPLAFLKLGDGEAAVGGEVARALDDRRGCEYIERFEFRVQTDVRAPRCQHGISVATAAVLDVAYTGLERAECAHLVHIEIIGALKLDDCEKLATLTPSVSAKLLAELEPMKAASGK